MASPSSVVVDLSQSQVLAPATAGQWLVILPLVLSLVSGAVLIMLRERPRLQAGLALASLAGLVVLHAALLAEVLASGIVTMTMGRWLPPFGISFTADLTGAFLSLAGAMIGLLSGIHALGDIDSARRRYGFYPLLMMLMAGASGAFLTGDIFNLYVWFEVLLISAFGLIVLGSEKLQLDGTLKYAALNLMGTTLFLVATGLVYASFGTLNMADLARKAPLLAGTAPLLSLAALYFLALGIKAAAFPVNAWLPAAYHTPRITVGALFAGLLTKIAVYALIRVQVMILAAEGEMLSGITGLVAIFTMLAGAAGALAQDDIRRMAGYLVIAGIGTMLAGVAIDTGSSIAAVLFYALHSMLAMTALYYVCGLMYRAAGTWSLTGMAGLYRQQPLLSALALVVFFSVAGIPPFSGFWPKVMLVKAGLDFGSWWLAGTLLLTGFLNLVVVARVFAFGFWRDSLPGAASPGAQGPVAVLPVSALGPLVVLVVAMTAIGLYPEPVLQLVQQAATGLIDSTAYVDAVFPQGVSP